MPMMISSIWRSHMIRNTRMTPLAVLALGGLLGYLAASAKLNVLQDATAKLTQRPVTSTPRPSPLSPNSVIDSCCSEGATKGQILARADAIADDDAKPDKPNGKEAPPGSPAGTRSISGKQLPPPPQKFGGKIEKTTT